MTRHASSRHTRGSRRIGASAAPAAPPAPAGAGGPDGERSRLEAAHLTLGYEGRTVVQDLSLVVPKSEAKRS